MKVHLELKAAVMAASSASTWSEAVKEWCITSLWEAEGAGEVCVCGKRGLRLCYQIENRVTEKALWPIGSSCIRSFDRKDLTDEAKTRLRLLLLHQALERGDDLADVLPLLRPGVTGQLWEVGAVNDLAVDLLRLAYRKRETIPTEIAAGNRMTEVWCSRVSRVLSRYVSPYLAEMFDAVSTACGQNILAPVAAHESGVQGC